MTTGRFNTSYIECDQPSCDSYLQSAGSDAYFKRIKWVARREGWLVSPGGKATCARCRTDALIAEIVD